MTRLRIAIFPLLLVLLFGPDAGQAAGVSGTGAQFLKIPVGVRSAGMGDSFAAVSDDASAAFWNTAGLAQIENPEIQLFHASLFQNLNYEFAGAVIPLRPGTVLGLAGALNHTPAFNSTNNPSAVLGEASDLAFGVGLARQFGPCLSFGLGGKFVQSKLMASSANGMGLDGGLLLTTKNKRFSLGLSAQNIGEMGAFSSQSTREKLPASYRAGLAGRFWAQKKFRPLLSVEAQKTPREDPVFHSGVEIWVGSMEKCVAFRAGYQSNKLTKNLGDLVGASFGTGIRFQSLQFDYAFVPYGLLGDTQRFSVSYRFGGRPVLDEAPSKVMNVDVKPQLADVKTGSIKTATFDLKPEARTDIKNWALDITDSKGNILKSYSGKGVPPRSLTWDGKDEQGNIVTGGLFSTYNMRTIDKRGQQVIASDAIFKVQSADVALRSVDQRVLALHPEALASLGITAPTGGSSFSQPPVLPQTLQPVGDLGAIKVPGVPFGARTSDLRKDFRRYLDQVAALIRKYPAAKVYIEGHAYDEGPETENVSLSQRRADAVLRYLVEVGKVASDRLYSRGHGSSAPLDVGKSEAARSRNRRVDIVILTK